MDVLATHNMYLHFVRNVFPYLVLQMVNFSRRRQQSHTHNNDLSFCSSHSRLQMINIIECYSVLRREQPRVIGMFQVAERPTSSFKQLACLHGTDAGNASELGNAFFSLKIER